MHAIDRPSHQKLGLPHEPSECNDRRLRHDQVGQTPAQNHANRDKCNQEIYSSSIQGFCGQAGHKSTLSSNILLGEDSKRNESTKNSNLDTKISNLSCIPRNSIEARANCKLDDKFASNPNAQGSLVSMKQTNSNVSEFATPAAPKSHQTKQNVSSRSMTKSGSSFNIDEARLMMESKLIEISEINSSIDMAGKKNTNYFINDFKINQLPEINPIA